MEKMNLDEFGEWLDQFPEEDEVEDVLAIDTLEEALTAAKSHLCDFLEEKQTTVINVFEYKDGYQFDIISNHKEFEIYADLYEGEDVVAQVYFKDEDIVVNYMK